MTEYGLKRHFDSRAARLLGGLVVQVHPPFDLDGYVAEAGARVYVSSRKADACAETAAEIGGTGIAADLSSEDECVRLAAEVGEREERVHLLVNNAGWGIFRPVTPRKELLDIPSWPYAEMAEGWGGFGVRVRTRAELREALRKAHSKRNRPYPTH